jgi:hypothetical protein
VSKYEGLRRRLESESASEIAMSFGEIESLLGFPLPPSARRHRAFWSNNADNNVMTRAWREAGFRAARVDLDGGALTFVRDRPGEGAMALEGAQKSYLPPESEMTAKARHPVIGCMKGTVTFLPGVDLTEPADPDWERLTYGEDE